MHAEITEDHSHMLEVGWSHGCFKLDVSYQDITFFIPTFLEGNGKPLNGMYVIITITSTTFHAWQFETTG